MKNKWHDRGDHFAVELWRRGTYSEDSHARRHRLYALVDMHGLMVMQAHPGTWGCTPNKTGTTYYVQAKRLEGGRWRSLSLHREITGCPPGLEVDHRDHNGLNNQGFNLLVCTHAVNMQNIRPDNRIVPAATTCSKCGAPRDRPKHCWCRECRNEYAREHPRKGQHPHISTQRTEPTRFLLPRMSKTEARAYVLQQIWNR